ncbi:Oligoxyloglucan reducing end-specific cellobiohydrolase [Tilletiaria anomala UBC 951]|uniref:Oligoxyloglucan reducing end-specific cellobiohydrolase n=1 Tax=Tilletiaria anomala (strain ATCC 24038 / CBS 436.72 / UBC 951) TaxID=1037660 RepID=A0A066VVG0_TILAU|nr:Oligoxyloglucan reducing end-specific cellobiohydrolase [Tilletiaria anomala UBC 951]KDN45461.1 Oligoxyloglucan reducing end-specific cellobiohydrolase [Tilletiaria anomala UBC 951]
MRLAAAGSGRVVAALFLLLLQCMLPLALLVSSSNGVAAVASKPPAVTVNRFETLPAKVYYFVDSRVVLWHSSEENAVWRSEDEGKTWSPLEVPKKGEAHMLIEHPFDKSTAYILSKNKEHWRTIDRGRTWQKFTSPEIPAERSMPLEFNADPKHWDHIIFIGKKCVTNPWFGMSICRDEAYLTTNGFESDPQPMFEYINHCMWAKATPTMEISTSRLNRIFCIGASNGQDERSTMRLYYSDDFFQTRRIVSLGIGRDARNFIGIGSSKKFLITALKEPGNVGRGGGHTVLFVSTDGEIWRKARFPHGNKIRENGYTIVSSTDHSLVVDVKEEDISGSRSLGALFTSSSDGIDFVQSLENTHQNKHGIVDYEHLDNIDGVMLVNVEMPSQGPGQLQTRISFDDGSRWSRIKVDNLHRKTCKTDDIEHCSLHLHSVSHLHNVGKVFSSTAPGFVMGVGSVGNHLKQYKECDTWLSTDAGQSWMMVAQDAHKYEFGDQGSILVLAPDEDSSSKLKYSRNYGKTWKELDLGVTMRVKFLTTIPDNTSQKFLLVGLQARQHGDSVHQGRVVAVFIDFAAQGLRQCGFSDLEKWYAQTASGSCLMGHKQWYMRRKADADCYVGNKFQDPVDHEDRCECTGHDYECDFGYLADSSGKCSPEGEIPLPAGACTAKQNSYLASSGYRKIPGNTCQGGAKLDEPVRKSCKDVKTPTGQISTQRTDFPAKVVDYLWIPDSPNVLVQLSDSTIWQSTNEGLSWQKVQPLGVGTGYNALFLHMTASPYDRKRAYLVTAGQMVQYTTDGGRTWQFFTAPLEANGLGVPVLDFHPTHADWLIWTGSRDCASSMSATCHAEAYYSQDHGRTWKLVDTYVRVCSWLRDAKLKLNPRTIVCESYIPKEGNQRSPTSTLQIVSGAEFYARRSVLFDHAVAFATFDEYFVVAKLDSNTMTIRFEVSLNGVDWAEARFPPGTSVAHRAYTALESSTDAIFLHVTMNSKPGSEYGTLFKSNSNGTYFSTSIDQVNRNRDGYVDFEKMFGLNGTALVNIVSNANGASISGVKELQSRITHNDGARWKPIPAPAHDSNGNPYKCIDVSCTLHLHSYTERDDPSSTFSSPSAVGQMIGVGNVGKKLLPYAESDTFFTRDGGFTWSEVRKGAHRWEFGDQGSIIVLVDDEGPTDHFVYTLDEGLSWKTHSFGDKLRIRSIVTGPFDRRRKFVLLGQQPHSSSHTTAVHIDFSQLAQRQCHLLENDSESSDFELWSPSELRDELCLFGQQVYYWRRKQHAECYIGDQGIANGGRVTKTCACTDDDFECEFNHYRDVNDRCVLVPGATLLAAHPEAQCRAEGQEYWYERTPYRKIPMSQCEGGPRPDRGKAHHCGPTLRGHGFFWWITMIFGPFMLAGVVAYWWFIKGKVSNAGRIRLPGGGGVDYRDWTVTQTLNSVPYFVIGALGELLAFAKDVAQQLPFFGNRLRRNRGSYGGYRTVSSDEDAEILRDYDEDGLE